MSSIDRDAYPALHEFFVANLHEDVFEEYDSVPDAVAEFVAFADEDEVKSVREEWTRLDAALAGKPLAVYADAITALGSAWAPQDADELARFREEMLRTEPE